MTVKLCYYGNPLLRVKTKPVENITDELKKTAQEMMDQLEPWQGSGVAAPQVGINQRFFVLSYQREHKDGSWSADPAKLFVNPKITNPSEETWVCEEGCLSIPGVRVHVERPWSIDVEYTDVNGTVVQEHLEGYPARQFMHENDHLNGVLMIDRIDKKIRRKIDTQLQKIKKEYKV